VKDDSPTIVHCSAGVGRTGVTIALDAAASLLEKGIKIDPTAILKEMRSQRGCLIQENS
jgi:tyrosine-protein phosphatase non-receptor type 14/21